MAEFWRGGVATDRPSQNGARRSVYRVLCDVKAFCTIFIYIHLSYVCYTNLQR
jgi:hypothetical protein